MRLREGDEFRASPATAVSARGCQECREDSVRAEVREVTRQEPQPGRVVEVWCALVRANRFDWALEKCVEAGADVIRPLLAGHAARREGSSATRQERWQRIVHEAMEQCERLYPALIERPARFDDLLARHHGTIVVADGAGKPWSDLQRLLPERGTVAVAIGPEGGFSEVEVARGRAAGALVASLGPNNLRSETAAVVATALLRAY
jgi:16S rRNA (uracil1498-N3)-methyltransferase